MNGYLATTDVGRNPAQRPAPPGRSRVSLRLHGYRWLNHYFPALLLSVLPLSSLVVVVRPPVSATAGWAVGVLTVALAALAALLARRQRRALSFWLIPTQRNAEETYELVLGGMKQLGWVVTRYRRYRRIEARTPGFPATWLSWGEMVTVRLSGKDVLVNSICDPDARPSVISWGRNRKNVSTIAELLRTHP